MCVAIVVFAVNVANVVVAVSGVTGRRCYYLFTMDAIIVVTMM